MSNNEPNSDGRLPFVRYDEQGGEIQGNSASPGFFQSIVQEENSPSHPSLASPAPTYIPPTSNQEDYNQHQQQQFIPLPSQQQPMQPIQQQVSDPIAPSHGSRSHITLSQSTPIYRPAPHDHLGRLDQPYSAYPVEPKLYDPRSQGVRFKLSPSSTQGRIDHPSLSHDPNYVNFDVQSLSDSRSYPNDTGRDPNYNSNFKSQDQQGSEGRSYPSEPKLFGEIDEAEYYTSGSFFNSPKLKHAPFNKRQSSINQLRMHGLLDEKKKGEAPFQRNKSVIEAALLPKFSREQTNILNDAVNHPNFDEDEVLFQLENEGIIPMPNLIPKYPLDELIPFLTRLACVFHASGSPANRTEWHMSGVCEAMGVVATFAVVPTMITITFGSPEGMDAVSRAIRVDQNIVACGRLYLIDRLMTKITRGNITLYEAQEELQSIVDKPPYYSNTIRMVAQALCSAAGAIVCFNGSWRELLFSMILGLLVGSIGWISSISSTFSRVSDIVAAMVISMICVPLTAYFEGLCYSGVVLSALIWTLPGLPLTLAVRELATGNMMAGTVRMFAAFLTAFKLGFGIAIGSAIPFWVSHSHISDDCTLDISAWWRVPLFFIIVVCFNILLDTHVNQWPGQIATSAVGYLINFIGVNHLSVRSDVTVVVAAFGVGITGNLYSKFTHNSGLIYIFSGILLIVPGSVGVQGAASFFDSDAWSGLNFGFTMVLIGFSVTVGTLVADLLIYPRRSPEHMLF